MWRYDRNNELKLKGKEMEREKKCLNGRSLDSFQLCLLTLQYVLFYESKVQFEVQISNKITQPQPGGAYWGRGDLSQLIFVCCIQKVAKTSLYVPP